MKATNIKQHDSGIVYIFDVEESSAISYLCVHVATGTLETVVTVGYRSSGDAYNKYGYIMDDRTLVTLRDAFLADSAGKYVNEIRKNAVTCVNIYEIDGKVTSRVVPVAS